MDDIARAQDVGDLWTPTDEPYDHWRQGEKWLSHYVGDHAGVWYASFRDPHKPQSKTRIVKGARVLSPSMLADFKARYPEKLDNVKAKFRELELHIRPDGVAYPKIRGRLANAITYFQQEIESVRASFERNNHARFRPRMARARNVLDTNDPVVKLERLFAELLFQLDELRQCAKQNSYAYTLEDLVNIYAALDELADKLVRNAKGQSTLERQFGLNNI